MCFSLQFPLTWIRSLPQKSCLWMETNSNPWGGTLRRCKVAHILLWSVATCYCRPQSQWWGLLLRPFWPLSHLGKVSIAPNGGLSGLPQSQAANLQDHAHLQEWEVLEWLVLSLFPGDQLPGRIALEHVVSQRRREVRHPALFWALASLRVNDKVACGCFPQAAMWYRFQQNWGEGNNLRLLPGHNIWALSFCSCSWSLWCPQIAQT